MSKYLPCFIIVFLFVVWILTSLNYLKLEIGLGFTISLIASLIAYYQYQNSMIKLKLDLFEKRYKVYDATRKFLHTIISKQKYSHEDLNEFYIMTSDCEILFGQKTSDYLKEIRTKAQKMSLAKEEMLSSNFDTEERNLHMIEEQKNRYWLDDQIIKGKLNDMFKKHLDFSNIKN